MSAPTTAFHCSADWHLTRLGKYAVPIHSLMMRVQTDGLDFYGSVPNMAEYFGAGNEHTIRKQLHAARDMGFIEEIESRVGNSTFYRALTHKEWKAKYPDRAGSCCVKREKDNPSHKMQVPQEHNPLQKMQVLPSHKMQVLPLQKMHQPPAFNARQVSELVSEVVSEQSPEGSSGRNASHSLSAIPSLSQTEQQKPSSEENLRPWVFKIWKAETSKDLNVRKTDLLRLERFIEKHGEQKAARAWFAYVNAEPRPYHLEPVEMAVKRKGKNGQEWLEGAEDESKVTTLPLAAFFAVTPGYLVAADEPLDKYGLDKFNKASGNYFGRMAT